MVNVNEIINEVNKSIKGFLTDSSFALSNINGLAKSIERDGNTMPCSIDLKGNAKYLGIDDKFNLIVYHKINTVTPSINKVSQFGDGNKKITVDNQLSLIIFANKEKLKLEQEVLANYILASMPTNIDNNILLKESLSECIITVSKVNFDSTALYKREYQKDSLLKPHQMLFEINYNIVYSFNKSCINTCKC